MSSDRNYAAIAHKYAADVISGRIVACKWTILACKRHQNDLARSRAGLFEYVWDDAKAARVCDFIEGLPYPSEFFRAPDEKTITLEPWQIFNTASLFGWVKLNDSTKYRFRHAYLTMARKNAKSTWAAGVATYKFAAENESGAQVFFGAASREQANEVGLIPAMAMIEGTPELIEAFGLKLGKRSITKKGDRTAIMKTIIGKCRDGQHPHCAVIDEYHEHADETQYEAMKNGMGARKNPLLIIITTAGYDLASPCRKLQDTAEQILDGLIVDERRFVNIYTLDEGDEYSDITVAGKSNPNMGASVDPEYLESQITSALNSPSEEPGIKTKNFNLWVANKNPWIRIEDWNACEDTSLKLEDFEGEEAHIGLDLADVCDLASKMRMFPRQIGDELHFYLFGEHYLNAARVREKHNAHLAIWVKDGWLIETPGNTTSYPTIMAGILEDCGRFLVKTVPYDPHHAGPLVQFIQEDPEWDQGAEFVEILPRYEKFSPAMKEFHKAVLEHRVHHDGDPVLAWCISNTIAKTVARDAIVPDKKRNELKIDAAIATLNAFMCGNVATEDTAPDIDDIGPAVRKKETPEPVAASGEFALPAAPVLSSLEKARKRLLQEIMDSM
jgi:phage terminase large subunit-like protein